MFLTPVDCAARAIVALSNRADGARQTYHLVGDVETSNKDLIAAAQELGYAVKSLPGDEWLSYVAQNLDDRALEPIAPYLMAYPEETFRRMLDPMAFPPVSAEFTLDRLAEAGVAPSEPGRDLLVRYLSHLQDIGFLDPPEEGPAAGRVQRPSAAE
jgi:hypothetical protein